MIFAAVVLTYGHTLRYPFYFDDLTSIIENKAIQDPGNFEALWKYAPLRIVGYFTFALNHHLHGLALPGYHLVNLFVHALTGAVVLLFCRSLLSTPALAGKFSGSAARWFPLLAALLFVLHPLQTQAVTYIVQRLASLAALFYLSALSWYVEARIRMTTPATLPGENRIRLSAMAAFFFTLLFTTLALFTKQNTVTLLLAFVLVEVLFFRLSLKKLLAGIGILILLGAVAYIAAVFFFRYQPFSLEAMEALTRETKAISRTEYLATQSRVLWTYLRLFFLPVGLHIDHDVPISPGFSDPRVLIAGSGHLLLFLLAAVYARRQPLLAFAVFFFYIANLVESSVIPISDVLFEHRAYLPNAGLVILVASAVITLTGKSSSRAPAVALILLLAILAFSTYSRNRVWRDPVTLWQDCVNKAPDKARPNNNLGKSLYETGETDQALRYLTRALAVWPDYAKAHNNIGLLYAKLHNEDAAIRHLKAAVAIEPDYENAHNNLGFAYHEKGDLTQAEIHYQAALRLKPDSIKAHNNWARLLASRGDTSGAISHLEESLRLAPDYAIGQNNLGQLYAQEGELDKAITHYEEAVRLDPGYAKAFYNLGLALARKGEVGPAAKNFTRALEINPGYKEAEMGLRLLRSDQNAR